MSTADSPASAGLVAATFYPRLLGYSAVWQVYRAPSGASQISIQLVNPAPMLNAIRMAVAGLDAGRLIARAGAR